MYQQFFAGLAWTWLPLLALALFVTMFALMLALSLAVVVPGSIPTMM